MLESLKSNRCSVNERRKAHTVMCRSRANVAVSYAQACCSNTCQLILTVDNCMSTQHNTTEQNRTGSVTSVYNNTTATTTLLSSCLVVFWSSSWSCYFTLLLFSCHFVLSWGPAPSPSTSAAHDMPFNRHYCQTSETWTWNEFYRHPNCHRSERLSALSVFYFILKFRFGLLLNNN